METLHFTLGPVQNFVSQARRTRDFWAGSFLLSYLAGKAMEAVVEAGGDIVFPVVQDHQGNIGDPLLRAIRAQKGVSFTGDFPLIGSIPNRFTARVPEGFTGAVCVAAVHKAWQGIADAIWENYIAPVANYGQGTEAIWSRQVAHFWQMSWVMGTGHELLEQRKNWRSYLPPEEPGDKCTLMGSWQELSGYVRSRNRQEQAFFWSRLRQTVGREAPLELREDERLCAIALIKRLFPRLFRGARLAFPSTSYLAAIPWLIGVLRDEKERLKAREFAAVAKKAIAEKETPPEFFRKDPAFREMEDFLRLDGTCFYHSTLGNDRLWSDSAGSRQCRLDLSQLLKGFQNNASPFYALLLMDGDRLGALLRGGDERSQVVSSALKDFSQKVDRIVVDWRGITIYAGGDDVLALLPLDTALTAAVKLKDSYADSFKKVGLPEATISGAIVYAHHHAPLRQVINRAHESLDQVAKDQTGRNALVVTVWKTGGVVLSWSAPWRLLDDQGQEVELQELVKRLVSNLGDKKLTNSWIYNIRRLFRNPYGSEFAVTGNLDVARLLTAELLQSREVGLNRAEAAGIVGDLLTLCCRQWRDGSGALHRNDRVLTLDGALLIKFLVTKGAEV